ncbi:hypothetical protein BGZ61DRAFT_219593 [Ilyonectria robusta]|uniref:uncharacterized protein n=1 Tax=Ilyonectria robusta TaxID=1079257 RepID=UPI001E8CD45C|nr:uncharacterized protein BGZ61DRAFT_219593 [Ilyonectria robusta]KAH8706348.1 hypothetical protein BGZ61DRAFT_219593 [Ilyonectria robusta]
MPGLRSESSVQPLDHGHWISRVPCNLVQSGRGSVVKSGNADTRQQARRCRPSVHGSVWQFSGKWPFPQYVPAHFSPSRRGGWLRIAVWREESRIRADGSSAAGRAESERLALRFPSALGAALGCTGRTVRNEQENSEVWGMPMGGMRPPPSQYGPA